MIRRKKKCKRNKTREKRVKNKFAAYRIEMNKRKKKQKKIC